MRKEVVRFAGLAALLLGAAVAWGQQPAGAPAADKKTEDKPAKSKLEEMLEKALQDNPDVRLAQAKLAEAEAELNRARLLVVQKVASAYQAVEAQKAAVESATAELDKVKTAAAAGAVSQADLRVAEQQLIEAKAKLADLESQLPYLIGQQPQSVDEKILQSLNSKPLPTAPAYAEMLRRDYLDLLGRLPTPEELASGIPPKPMVQGPTADRIRAALDKPFNYDGKTERIDDVLLALKNAFEKDNPGLLLNVNGLAKLPAPEELPATRFDRVPYGAALEWVEDTVPDCRVVVRDYGIVIAPKDQQPPGAPLLHDFWKGAKAEDKNAPPSAKEQSAKPVKGEVKHVDKDGQVLVNIGKKDGLAMGNILTVFRIRQETETPLPLFVGRVRVVEVGDSEAAAVPEGAAKLTIVPGDKVQRIDK